MKFFDANCMIGMRGIVKEGEPTTHEEILELMERCGIEKAIAYHAMAKEADLPTGNRKLLDEIKGDERFVPQWCVLPQTFGEYLSADELFDEMKKNGVSSIRLLPKTCGYSLKPHSIGKLMDNAAQCKMPVFIDLSEIPTAKIYDLCKDFPEVNFVVSDISYRENRWLGPILDTCPNLYLGVGKFLVHNGIKQLCRHYGAERWLFDTNLPTGSATSAVSLIYYAEISQEEKELIAHGNVERLLAEVKL